MTASPKAADAERQPVIVGIGEIAHRTKNLGTALEPLELMARALRAADLDGRSSGGLLGSLDSLDVVCEYSWPYADAPGLLCQRLGIAPRHAAYGEMGGESPVRLIHEATIRIARGESQWAAVVGAESQYSVAAAQKAGVTLPWTPSDNTARLVRGPDFLHPVAVAHGVATPTNVYPFYENAAQAAWGQTPHEALAESASLWSRFSAVAAENPHAWLRRRQSPEEIATVTPDNRLIAWPYTKSMVANPMVNMGGAVLLSSLAAARRAGIPEHRMVAVRGGAAAKEPRDYLQRDCFFRSHAQEAVLRSCLKLAGGEAARFAMAELYSCFPVVPKMARRVLGLPSEAAMTATGGLSFFGAPLHNYMTHAACGLVRALRQTAGRTALLYGQGEYVTKHHALVLGNDPEQGATLSTDYSVQAEANATMGLVPPLQLEYEGPAAIETFTVLYDRGVVRSGVIIASTPQGARLMAGVPASDGSTLNTLTSLNVSAIGSNGFVCSAADGLLRWKAA